MPTPHINTISPASGPIGTHVSLGGSNFGGTAVVNFNGVIGTILSNTGSTIIVVVPPGASTGPVLVSVGELVSNAVTFTVTGALVPGITTLTPSSGGTGIPVVIAGGNFGATQSTSTVTFNGVVALITSWSNTSITAIVPSTARTGPVLVTTSAGVSNSHTFTVTNPSNGGTPGPLKLFLIPAQTFTGVAIWTFDTTNFDDASFGSFYNWKVEDVLAGRTPTISRVIISYRDLGVATLTVALTGTDDAANVVTSSQEITIGTVGASGRIASTLVGIALTGQNLQLSVTRAAGVGPVSITKVRMEGRVEITVY